MTFKAHIDVLKKAVDEANKGEGSVCLTDFAKKRWVDQLGETFAAGDGSFDLRVLAGEYSLLVVPAGNTIAPVLFGVLTCNTLEQANARSGGQTPTKGKDRVDSRIGNKGIECAEAALELVDLIARLPRE